MTRTLLLMPLLSLGLSLSACGEKIDAVQGGVCALDLGAVTYTGQIKAILDNRCTGCHAASLSGTARSGAPPSVNLDSFGGLKAAAAETNKRVQNGSMPPSGGVPQDERALLQCWLDLGALEQ